MEGQADHKNGQELDLKNKYTPKISTDSMWSQSTSTCCFLHLRPFKSIQTIALQKKELGYESSLPRILTGVIKVHQITNLNRALVEGDSLKITMYSIFALLDSPTIGSLRFVQVCPQFNDPCLKWTFSCKFHTNMDMHWPGKAPYVSVTALIKSLLDSKHEISAEFMLTWTDPVRTQEWDGFAAVYANMTTENTVLEKLTWHPKLLLICFFL